MGHMHTDEAEKILDTEYRVLDKGFVRLVDYMGSDQRIVQSARVSYGEGTKSLRQDKGLINYLLRNDHTSPFEQVVFTFHTKMPVFVARQWVRHRTARINEISARYSIMPAEYYVPADEDIQLQSTDNKQGRSTEKVPAEVVRRVKEALEQGQKEAHQAYETLLADGIARELARINLPLSLYTEWYWQIDLHNLFHFLRLRMDAHAQKEIRAYAQAMYTIAKTVCPLACEAFEEHVLHRVQFSKSEKEALADMLDGNAPGLEGKALERFKQKLAELKQE